MMPIWVLADRFAAEQTKARFYEIALEILHCARRPTRFH
jgi:hypothetical protein